MCKSFTGLYTPEKTMWRYSKKKGVPSAVGFPHCAGSGEGLSLSLKPYPHKCAEAGARTRDLPVTDGRLYRCTRPALLSIYRWNRGLKIFFGKRNLVLIYIVVKGFYISMTPIKFIHYRFLQLTHTTTRKDCIMS